MVKYAVIKSGGKQYLVKENDEIVIDRLEGKENEKIGIEKLAQFDNEKEDIELGGPILKDKVNATILSQLKGDKIRVAKFKAKVRYRKVRGFRPRLTKIKITKI
ncbi:50S ribosomal protein L21 [Candidatus Roizmanbacteria bacterium]|nr:50S ribosomal protein L21 [Candidatus Roizmanbacteria bacterium]